MIQAAPPPAVQCVKATEVNSGSAFVTVGGAPADVSAFLAEAKSHREWSIVADATSNGVRFGRLRADINLPDRSIGGLIYSAQSRRLSAGMTTDPLICEIEEE